MKFYATPGHVRQVGRGGGGSGCAGCLYLGMSIRWDFGHKRYVCDAYACGSSLCETNCRWQWLF